MGYNTIEAKILAENTASIRFFEKYGFNFVKTNAHGEVVYSYQIDK